MRKKIILALAVLSAMALVAVAPVFAQDGVKAKIPFAFNVGSKTLPSGNYELRNVNYEAGSVLANSLLIQSAATHEVAMAPTMAASPQKTPAEAVLVFHQYGDAYFLSAVQVWDNRRTLEASKLEREVANKSAESAENAPPREVYVAANTR